MSARLSGEASLLRIHLTDFDKYRHHSLYRYITDQALKAGLAGCTTIRGLWGYGARGIVHSDISGEGAGERPIVIELVDTREKIRDFARQLGPWIERARGTVTEQRVIAGDAPALEEEMTQLTGEEGVLLRIYCGEADRHGSRPLFEAVVEDCKANGINGCTVTQGILGYGPSGIVREGHLLPSSQDLPIVIEVIDSPSRIEALLGRIGPWIAAKLFTKARVRLHAYRE